MTKKNLIIVALVLIVLAVGSRYLSKSGAKSQDPRIGQAMGGNFQVDQLDSIRISSSNESIRLVKNGEIWTLPEKDGFPANMREVVDLVEKASSYKIASLVTQRKERHEEFQLVSLEESSKGAEGIGSSLIFSTKDQKLFELIVGKQRSNSNLDPSARPSAGGTYIRFAADDKVYLIKENLFLSVDKDRWIDKTLFSIEKNLIKSIRLESSGNKVSFERTEPIKDFSISPMSKSETLIMSEVNLLIEQLKSLNFQDYAALSEEKGKDLDKKAAVSVDLFNFSQLEFQILASKGKEKSEYWYKITSVPDLATPHGKLFQNLIKTWFFQVPEYQAKNWLKNRKDFIQNNK